MLSWGFLILLLIPLSSCAPLTTDEASAFLEAFYITPASLRSENDGEPDDPAAQRLKALKMFQESSKIPVTGVVDEATREKMAAPRCGVPEFASLRNGDDWWWPKKELSYSLDTSGSGMTDAVTRNAVQRAFAVWSAVTPLKFHEVSGQGDLNIKFARRAHNCFAGSFDGKWKTLAHAFMPEDGDIHFDADEKWTVMSANNLPVSTHVDFLTVAIHEIGHAIGLDHVYDDVTSILAPAYNKPIDRGNYAPPELDKTVIARIQRLYGKAPTTTSVAAKPSSFEANPPSGKYCLWAANRKYMRSHAPGGSWRLDQAPHCMAHEHWTAEVYEGKVAFKSFHGPYLSVNEDGSLTLRERPAGWERFTAYGNTEDNSWAFKSYHGSWLSAYRGDGLVVAQPHNKKAEHWWIIPVNE